MKRIITILSIFIVLVMLWYIGDLSHQIKLKEGTLSIEGIIVINNSYVYLVEDSDFTEDDAVFLSVDEIIGTYQSVFMLNGIGTSLKDIESGDKVRIWYSEIQESQPGGIDVLKIEKM